MHIGESHHVIPRKKLLQKLSLLMHDSLNDELVVLGDIEHRATGPRIGKLNEGLVTQRVLQKKT